MWHRVTAASPRCSLDTLFYHKDIPIGVVISGTESANHGFEKYCPKMLIYDEYSPEIIEKFLERQRKISDQLPSGKRKVWAERH